MSKPFQNSLMDVITGNKLPVVKADAVVQKQLNVGYNQSFAVLVNGMLQFIFNLGEAIQYDFPFTFRQMKCFIGLIAKESIVLKYAG